MVENDRIMQLNIFNDNFREIVANSNLHRKCQNSESGGHIYYGRV